MIMVNVDQAIKKLTKNFSALSEREIKSAIVSGINRSLQFGKTESGRQIKNSYNINTSVLSGGIIINSAKSSLMIGTIAASGKPIQLSHFQPTFSFNKKSTTKYSKSGVGKSSLLKSQSAAYKKGVTVEIIKGKKSNIPYAFMIPGKRPVFARGAYKTGGAYGFMRRHKRVNKTGSDTPVSPLITVTVHSSLTNKRVIPIVGDKINDKFSERMLHELTYRMNKIQS